MNRATDEVFTRRTAVTWIAPQIQRQRLLIEGWFAAEVGEAELRGYFDRVTGELGLRTYAEPIVHRTSGEGKAQNEGFDAFVPLIDSGIYIAVWSQQRFLSTVLYTCTRFDEQRAVAIVCDHFRLGEHQAAVF